MSRALLLATLAGATLIALPVVAQQAPSPSPRAPSQDSTPLTPEEAAARPYAVITNPQWARPPAPAYPSLALANGVPGGRVVLSCNMLPDGHLTRCVIMSETPPGQGFAAAALAAAPRAQISRRTSTYHPEATVTVPLRFLPPMD